MPNRVLPSFLVLLVEREFLHNELIDLVQRQSLVTSLLDGHGDECHIAVWWFDVGIFVVSDSAAVFVIVIGIRFRRFVV